MEDHPTAQEAPSLWTPLERSQIEALHAGGQVSEVHLHLLYWLIWLSLLSAEELLRLLSLQGDPSVVVQTKEELAEQLADMTKRGLIDAIMLREPGVGRHRRYYATDTGLYCYLLRVRSAPPLSITRLAKAYPVQRQDVLERLAHPQTHLALSSLVTRLIAEGEPAGAHLLSYQQPWHHSFTVGSQRLVLHSDAALLIEQGTQDSYAFLVYVQSRQQTDRQTERWLKLLLDQRQHWQLLRQSWPSLLLLTPADRLPTLARLLLESCVARLSRPLVGGVTTLEALSAGLWTPIWWDLAPLARGQDVAETPRLPFAELLRSPATAELVEHFSRQQRFFALLAREARREPLGTKPHLARYVGKSLQYEAAHVNKKQLEGLLAARRVSRQSRYAAGLLTLALSDQEKQLLTWVAHHPLLDLPTLGVLLRPASQQQSIKPLQQRITRLFKDGLLEVRLWVGGATPLEQQRYLLTSVALKWMAIREGVPFSTYLMPQRYARQQDDEQLNRQWGTRGLAHQMAHTNGLYTFMRQLYQGTWQRGEVLVQWKSAHEAARWYRETISQEMQQARPDAEVLFAPAVDTEATTLLLEYDRATMGEQGYTRKFRAYLDYQQATGTRLPLIVIVTRSQKAVQNMQRVLAEVDGALPIVILLERDVLAHGLTLALHPP